MRVKTFCFHLCSASFLVFAPLQLYSAEPARAASRAAYDRVIVVVPMTGAGTYADPRRPAGMPRDVSAEGAGIHSWSYEPTADGKFAIAEVVAADRRVLAKIAAQPQVVKAFLRGKHSRQEIEQELQKLKPGFRLDRQPGRPQ